MKTKPILFSSAMIRRILSGQKTQTRRIIKPQPKDWQHGKILYKDRDLTLNSLVNHAPIQKGDILWVKETFEAVPIEAASVDSNSSNVQTKYIYKATTETPFIKWKPSIFMPKDAARIFLEVKNVRVERLQDITENDSLYEGIISRVIGTRPYDLVYQANNNTPNIFHTAKQAFMYLWNTINKDDGSWLENPYVWVYEFEMVKG